MQLNGSSANQYIHRHILRMPKLNVGKKKKKCHDSHPLYLAAFRARLSTTPTTTCLPEIKYHRKHISLSQISKKMWELLTMFSRRMEYFLNQGFNRDCFLPVTWFVYLSLRDDPHIEPTPVTGNLHLMIWGWEKKKKFMVPQHREKVLVNQERHSHCSLRHTTAFYSSHTEIALCHHTSVEKGFIKRCWKHLPNINTLRIQILNIHWTLHLWS